MLYLLMRVNCLQTAKVNPTLEEVSQFQVAKNSTHSGAGAEGVHEYMSDEDDWDTLEDSKLRQIIREDDGLKKFEVGSRVLLISG
jgi:hypothetical protein